MPRIAISYRRLDSAAITGRLFDRLAGHFGNESVFMDIDAIPLGVDFRLHIDGVLKRTDYLVVVVGSNWLGTREDGSRRIHDATDPVRIEVETAVASGVTIIPVLVDGAAMPAPSDVPETFAHFSYLNAAALSSGQDFHGHVDRLIRSLDGGRRESAVASGPSAPPNLPLQLAPLIGRDEELGEIRALLAASRLVTLIGAGGIGKTRIAVEIAATSVGEHGDAWFVDLAPIADPHLVPSAVAAVFGIRDDGGSQAPIERLAAVLSSRNVLIVLDNCEHLAAIVATTASGILGACPGARIIATSREPLGVPGEQTYRMPSLSAGDAAELFVARAHAADHRFVRTAENAPLIADIVRRLDGIALAIELAAPRVKVLSLTELRRRLDDRFKLLAGTNRAALPRHQTLRALIGWSYDLLDAAEARLFRRCAVFRGAWTLEAAEALCDDDAFAGDDVLALLSALVDKSLVVVEADDDQHRYRLLESTHQFALDALTAAGEREHAVRRHACIFAAHAQRASDTVWHTDPALWAAAVRLDLENYRAATDAGFAAGGDVVSAATIVAALRWYWSMGARREGRDLLDRAEAALPADAPPYVRGLLALAKAGMTTEGEADAAAAVAALAGVDAVAHAEALVQHGVLAGYSGRISAAVPLLEAGLAAARATGAARLIGFSLNYAAYWIGTSGDPSRALALFDEGATLLRACNDRRDLAYLEANRAELLFSMGDAAGALASARAAEALYREHGLEDSTLLNVPGYLLALGRLDEAWTSARESLQFALRTDSQLWYTIAIGHLAHVAAEAGEPVRAGRLLGHTDARYRKMGWVRGSNEQRSYDRARELLRAAFPEEQLCVLITQGETLERETAVSEALAIARPAGTGAVAAGTQAN